MDTVWTILKVLAGLAILAQPIVGWSGLKQYFTDQLPDLDFTKNRPNSDEKKWIQSRLAESAIGG